MSWKLVIAGIGGQGVISAGIILAEAAVIHEGTYAVQSQTYGAEMRGGLSRTDVTVSATEVIYPKVDQAHVLVCIHRKALAAYAGVIRPGGLLITDRDAEPVARRIDSGQILLPLDATAREATGSSRNTNICTLGALAAITRIVRRESLEAALTDRFGDAAEPAAALAAGFALGEAHRAAAPFQVEAHEAGRHATSARL